MKNKSRSTKKKDKVYSIIAILKNGLIFILVGILMMLCLYIFENDFHSISDLYNETRQNQHGLYIYIIQPIVYNLATLLIVLGIGSFFLEIYSYTTFFKKRIAELFTEYDMIRLLTDDFKLKLRYNLMMNIYNPDCPDSESLLTLFDDKIGSCMGGIYYESHETHIHCSIVEDRDGKKFIQKKISKRIILNKISQNKKNTVKCLMGIICTPIGTLDYKCFHIEQIKIDGKILEDKDYDITEYDKPESRIYKKSFVCNLKDELEINKSLKLELNYTTVVPLEDRTYTAKMDLPCKSQIVYIQFEDSQYQALANGFKFSMDMEDRYDVRSNEGTTIVSSNGWVLPGEGVTFAITEK